MSILTVAYAATWDEPNYEPLLDFDGSGYIDFTDYSAFALHYGQPCP